MHPRDSSDANQAVTLPADPDPSALCPELTLLVVAPDRAVPTPLEAALEADSSVDARTMSSIGSVLQQLEGADCLLLVADPPSGTETGAPTAEAPTAGTDEIPDSSADVLARLRNYAPDFPVVAITATRDSETATEMATADRDQRWTVHVPITTHESEADLERVLRRITDLVEQHRLDGVVGRSLAGVELTQEPLAIVAPDGTFEYVTRRYTMQFGYDRDELRGQPWQTCFHDETVSHLESTAIATVTDGWRWTGHCTGREKSGDSVPLHVRLGGLEDGSLIFVVTERDRDADGDATTRNDAQSANEAASESPDTDAERD